MTRVYGGRSAEQRAGTRRLQLMAAGLELLGTRLWSEITVRGVCDEAGLSTRFFYESFENLEALALAIYDEIVTDTVTRVVTAVGMPGLDRLGRAHVGIEAMLSALADDPRRARFVLLETSSTAALAQRRTETMRTFTSVIATLGREEYDAGEDDEPLLQITATLIAGGLNQMMVAWLDGSLVVARAQLVDDCARLVVRMADAARSRTRP